MFEILSRPYGTALYFIPNPALKRWAIIGGPSGTGGAMPTIPASMFCRALALPVPKSR